MDFLKKLVSNMTIHLDVHQRIITISCGDNRISLGLHDDRRIVVGAELSLQDSSNKLPAGNAE